MTTQRIPIKQPRNNFSTPNVKITRKTRRNSDTFNPVRNKFTKNYLKSCRMQMAQ